jgi:pSer/pThr/pTyr-binding forkhead associated (FHA) protein
MRSMFLVFSDPGGGRQLLELATERVTIGRRPSCDVALPWDGEVSRLHAEIVRLGEDWVLCDDGLSHNGTFVNGERLRGRRRLHSGDAIAVGATTLSLYDDDPASTAPTRAARPETKPVTVTPAQRRLLEALSRPLRGGGVVPASNRQIATELTISVETVKGTLSALYELFGLTGHAQNEKRAALALRWLHR